MERRWAKQKQRDEADRDLVLAWQIQRLKLSVKKQGSQLTLAPLKEFLMRGPTADAPERQVAILHQMAAQYGLPVTVNGKVVNGGSGGQRSRQRAPRTQRRD